MNTEHLEYLLSTLINVNENILESLNDIKYDINTIKEELNWVEDHSYAKKVCDSLHQIELNLIDISVSTE